MKLFNNLKKEKKKKKIEKLTLIAGEKRSFYLSEVKNPTKLDLTIYDNLIKNKTFSGSESVMVKVNSAEMGLIYSNVSEEKLLALVPELAKYDGCFFGRKVFIEIDGKKEERYPVFFSIYPNNPEWFFDKKEKDQNITGFIYVTREALIQNKAFGLEIL